MEAANSPEPATKTRLPLNGRWIVAAMLTFGISVVGAMWLYWDNYTGAFRPLQNAIRQEIPDAQVFIVAGRHRSHLPGALHVLRIVIQYPQDDSNPLTDEQMNLATAQRIQKIAEDHVQLDHYDVLEIHLVQRVPEHEPRRWTYRRLQDGHVVTTPSETP